MEDRSRLADRILDQVADAVIYANRSGEIIRWNRASAASSHDVGRGQRVHFGNLLQKVQRPELTAVPTTPCPISTTHAISIYLTFELRKASFQGVLVICP